jgi:hypothetical protein
VILGVAAAAAAALALVPAAGTRPGGVPYFKAQAHFNVTIQGTYTANGTEVDTNCFRPPPIIGGDAQQITVTSNGTEALQFKSTRPVRLDAYLNLGGKSVGAGTNGLTPIAVTTAKTLTLTEPCRDGDEPPQCGTKRMRLAMSMVSREPPLRLLYFFSDRPGRIIFPDDPFGGLCTVPGLAWWGKLAAPPAPLPRAKLFNKKLKRFTVSGATAKSSHVKTSTQTTDNHYEVHYKITLVRLSR